MALSAQCVGVVEEGSGMKNAGVILAVLGAVALVGAVILGLVGGSGLRAAIEAPKVTIEGGRGVVELEGDTEYRIFEAENAPETVSCEVRSSDGAVVDQRTAGVALTLDMENGTWTLISHFGTGQAGGYAVDCADDVVVTTKAATDAVGRGAGGILGSVFAVMGALFMIIIGLLMAVVGNHRDKQRRG